METVLATYRLRCAKNEAPKIARYIAHEQTVEIPEEAVSPGIRDAVVGTVESIRLAGTRTFDAAIGYKPSLTGFQIPQLLNLIYGNVSIQKGIRLVDVELPPVFLRNFHGPNYGIPGLRRLLGVYGRPLLATAIKPNGASIKQFAQIARGFALGGGDIIKDDQNLAGETLPVFKERISRCQEAVSEVSAKTGRRTLYCPILTAPHEEIEERVEFAIRLGIQGFLVCPMLLGLDRMRRLAAKHPLVFLAHPSLTGTFFSDPHHGIEPGILLGRIFRLLGADASIFPNFGGRFSFTKKECKDIARHLTNDWPPILPAFPTPAGGMRFENLDEMSKSYGEEAIFLIGGALLTRPEGVQKAAQAFLAKIRENFRERLEKPQEPVLPSPPHFLPIRQAGPAGGRGINSAKNSLAPLRGEGRGEEEFVSACEISAPGSGTAVLKTDHLIFKDFQWQDRPPVAYKKSAELPFKDVARHELVGRESQQAFELRYFEIAPEGYTSLEKHRHTHTIVTMRGNGILIKDGRRVPVKPFDISYVNSMEVHQLRNESREPFGFFCIVDRDRDRPMKP